MLQGNRILSAANERRCISLLEQPSAFPEFLPVRAAGMLKDHGCLSGFLSSALKK
jgi:hypothetical protein